MLRIPVRTCMCKYCKHCKTQVPIVGCVDYKVLASKQYPGFSKTTLAYKPATLWHSLWHYLFLNDCLFLLLFHLEVVNPALQPNRKFQAGTSAKKDAPLPEPESKTQQSVLGSWDLDQGSKLERIHPEV